VSADDELSSQEAAPSLPYSKDEEKALVWKQDLAIIPLSAAIYFLCYLDR